MSAMMVAPPEASPNGFLKLDQLLTDDERMIRDTARRWVTDRVLPEIQHWYERGLFPRELFHELGELGLLGMHIDGFGCLGAGAVSYGLACMEMEAADSGLRSAISVQGSLAMFAIATFGTDEQKRELLPAMAAGDVVGCFGLTEPEAGSDPGSMRTVARRSGSDWVVSGRKAWITNGGIADVSIVWAQSDEAGGGIRGFLVPRDTPGFESHDIGSKHSLRASVTSELILEDCRLPAEAILPGARGLGGPLTCLNEARFGIIWGTMGAARTCYETALEYSKGRDQFSRAIASFQLTQQKLVNMFVELSKGILLALHLGRMKDAAGLDAAHVSLGKLNNAREALAICREARSILAANGISLEYPVIRHMNNLESVLTYEGTGEIHTLVLGQALTGYPAFK